MRNSREKYFWWCLSGVGVVLLVVDAVVVVVVVFVVVGVVGEEISLVVEINVPGMLTR